MTGKEAALKRVNRQIAMLTDDIERYSNHSNGELRNACITYRDELKFYQALHDALTSPATSCQSCEGLVKALEPFAQCLAKATDIISKNISAADRMSHIVRATTYWLSYNDFARANEAISEHRKNRDGK